MSESNVYSSNSFSPCALKGFFRGDYVFEGDLREIHKKVPHDSIDLVIATRSAFSYEGVYGRLGLLKQELSSVRKILKRGGKLLISPVDLSMIQEMVSLVPGLKVVDSGSMGKMSDGPRADWVEIQRID